MSAVALVIPRHFLLSCTISSSGDGENKGRYFCWLLFQHNSQVLLCLESLSHLCFDKESCQLSLLGMGLVPKRSVVTCPTAAGDWGMKSGNSALPITDNTIPSTVGKFLHRILPSPHALHLRSSPHSSLKIKMSISSS